MSTLRQIAQSCLMQKTRRAARSITALYETELAPAGLTGGQFSTLVALGVAGEPNMSALADLLGMDRTTLTRNLTALEREGLVWLRADPEDARVRLISLTEKGRERLAAAIPLWKGAQEKLKARVGSFAFERATTALDLISEK